MTTTQQSSALINFEIHTISSAPHGSKALLKSSLDNYGMIPNLHGIMAESPQTFQGYLTLTKLVMESSFTPIERHVLWLVINVENECHYCVPAHTLIAKQDGVADDIIEALRTGQPIPTLRLETLRQFALAILKHRGHPSPTNIENFLNVGFTHRQVLEVVLVIAHKVLSNYINALAETKLDPIFAQYAWAANNTIEGNP